MKTLPKLSNDSTPSPQRDLRVFHFLQKCYTQGFFTQFVNGYFLFLLEDSNRFKWEAADNFDKHLEMVFNPELVDAKCFSQFFLHCLLYDGPQRLDESGEITMLNSADKFLLSSKYTLMKRLEFEEKQMKNELLRQAGLLLIHSGRDSLKKTEPRFIITTRHGVNFCDTMLIKNSLLKYKVECSKVLERIDRAALLGRIYAPIVNEYFEFIDFTIRKFHNLLTYELKDVLNKWHQHYKQGKIDPEQNISESIQSVTGPLLYLQGRPSGSAQKK